MIYSTWRWRELKSLTPHFGVNTARVNRSANVRVSTVDQNEGRQLEGVKVDRKFIEKVSGKDVKRPQLEAMLGFLREGDTLVCHSMDRLARNIDDLRKLVICDSVLKHQLCRSRKGFSLRHIQPPSCKKHSRRKPVAQQQ